MAIRAPGIRTRHGKQVGGSSRNIIAALSLTAMVDMFTVLTIFLLQNYNATGEVIHIPKGVKLPEASITRVLKPSHVVIIGEDTIDLDDHAVSKVENVKNQKDWEILSLKKAIVSAFDRDIIEQNRKLRSRLKSAVRGQEQEINRKITLQADRSVDFLTIKKVMFTISNAGGEEINFAVVQKSKNQVAN